MQFKMLVGCIYLTLFDLLFSVWILSTFIYGKKDLNEYFVSVYMWSYVIQASHMKKHIFSVSKAEQRKSQKTKREVQ